MFTFTSYFVVVSKYFWYFNLLHLLNEKSLALINGRLAGSFYARTETKMALIFQLLCCY